MVISVVSLSSLLGAVISLFGRRGLITHNLLGLSVNPYGWKGIVLLQALGKIPLGVIMLITAINAIDQRHILASRNIPHNSIGSIFKFHNQFS